MFVPIFRVARQVRRSLSDGILWISYVVWRDKIPMPLMARATPSFLEFVCANHLSFVWCRYHPYHRHSASLKPRNVAMQSRCHDIAYAPPHLNAILPYQPVAHRFRVALHKVSMSESSNSIKHCGPPELLTEHGTTAARIHDYTKNV